MSDNYGVFQFANLLSHTASSEIDKALVVAKNAQFLQSEVETGVDRSRSAIGFSVQLNWLDPGNLTGSTMDIEILSRSIVEIIVRIKNPSKLLFCGMNYVLAATLNEIVPRVDYVNTTSIDYLEQYIGAQIPDDHIISMQDFASGVIDTDYDVFFVDTEMMSHDFSIIDSAWEKLAQNSLMILNTVNDFGALYALKERHPYFQYLSRLTEDDDKYLFHVPLATGFTFVVKK